MGLLSLLSYCITHIDLPPRPVRPHPQGPHHVDPDELRLPLADERLDGRDVARLGHPLGTLPAGQIRGRLNHLKRLNRLNRLSRLNHLNRLSRLSRLMPASSPDGLNCFLLPHVPLLLSLRRHPSTSLSLDARSPCLCRAPP